MYITNKYLKQKMGVMLIDANPAVTICTDNIGPIFTLGIIHMAVCIIST